MMTQKISIICLMLFSNFMNAQNKKIVEILNKQLETEYKSYFDEFEKENFELLKPYEIDGEGNLSFTFSEQPNYYDGKTIIKRSVPLKKIKRIEKDYNLVFFTDDESVIETQEIYDKNDRLIKKETLNISIFHTYIHKEKDNERLKKNLLKAFKKADLNVTNEYWYD